MISIRSARESDVPFLVGIGLRAWEQAVAGVADWGNLRQNAENAFVGFLTDHWLMIVVAEKGGTVAGWAAREELDDQITDLWVDPACQGHGVGSALLAEMERQIVEHGYEEAGLQTHARNIRALGFFKKHDYAIRWLSVAYSPKLDRDVESIGLSKHLVQEAESDYGPTAFV